MPLLVIIGNLFRGYMIIFDVRFDEVDARAG